MWISRRPGRRVIFSLLLAITVLAALWLGFDLSDKPNKNTDTTFLLKERAAPASRQPGSQPPGFTAALPAAQGASQAQRLFATPVWGGAVLPPLRPDSSMASRAILATGRIDPESLPLLKTLHKGDHIMLPLGERGELEGVVHLSTQNDGHDRIAGALVGETAGSFALSQDPANHRQIAGQVLLKDRGVGYEITTVADGVIVNKKPIDSMICVSMPRPSRPASDAPKTASAVAAGLAVPLLDSLPAARGVLYLDFDGETVTDPSWNYGLPIIAAPALVNGSLITPAQIFDVWQRVAEDYRPFNLTVTTDVNRYNSAPAGERARCIITPTSDWYSYYVGGVAVFKGYRGSHAPQGYTDTVPCWAFNNYNTSDMALTVSHELGHMMNLHHDGAELPTGHEEYYPGHDTTTPTSWGPLMGAPFDIIVTQWSKGEYPYANNQEDQIAIIGATIAEAGFVQGFIADDAGDSVATAANLSVLGTINQTGVISTSTDLDFYKFNTAGGTATITVQVSAPDPDLDSQITLYDASGNTLGVSSVQANSLGSTISMPLTMGTYYLSVGNKGRPYQAPTVTTPAVIGYSKYGSMGRYTLYGSYVPLPLVPLITSGPPPLTTLNQGAKLTLKVTTLSNAPVTYLWKKDGKAIPGKTASSLIFTSLQPGDAGSYTVDVTNVAGTVTSDPSVVEVLYKPVFTSQPLPAKSTVATGSSVTYTVVASSHDGVGSTTYAWHHNGVAMVPAQTSSTLTLPSVGWFDGGSYTCVATNAIGSTTSAAVALTVTSSPLFTLEPPLVKHLPLGGTGSVTVTVVGTAPITYQWYHGDGTKITGATKATFSWSAIQPAVAGDYYVVATNSLGSAQSTHVTVDAQTVPKIVLDPVAKTTVSADAILTLSCDATGTDPLVWHWQLNNVNLVNGGAVSGADTKTLTISPVAWTYQGVYRCVVTNSVGAATTKSATVSIISYPVILTPPAATTIATNGTGILKVVAGGTPALKYQWYKDSALIPNATGPTLSLARATTLATSGSYSVTVTNAQSPGGVGVTTTPVTVTVIDPLKFTLQPLKVTTGVGKGASFVAAASGGGMIAYQWQKNSKDIAGQTSASLDLTGLALTDAGLYRCIARNAVSTAASAAVPLSVLIVPTITAQPTSLNVYDTTKNFFTVKAAGSATLSYQWSKDDGTGHFVALPATAPGSKSTALTFAPVKDADAGTYKVTVSNGGGSVVSDPVTLVTKPVPLPVINDFSPHKSRITVLSGVYFVPSQIIVSGQYFTFVTKAHFGSTPAAFVRASDTEMSVSIPGNLTQPTALTLDDVTGSTTSKFQFTPFPQNYSGYGAVVPLNDDLINAQPLMYASASGVIVAPHCDNTLATTEAGEQFDYGNSLWYHWRPASTGRYEIETLGTQFFPELRLYAGPNVVANGYSDLSFLSYNSGGYSGTSSALISYYATKGGDYYIQIASSGYTDGIEALFGGTGLSIVKQGLYTNMTRDSETASDAQKASSDLPFSVGGTNAASVAWLPAAQGPAGSVVTVKADFSIDAVPGSSETFTWAVYDRSQAPVFGLLFESATRRVLSQTADGATEPAGQVFLPGTVYHLTMEVDYSRGVWGASLNGVSILEGQPLTASAISSGFGDVGVSCVPAPGSAQGGRLHYGHFSVSAAAPEVTK